MTGHHQGNPISTRNYTLQTRINRPVTEVFDAVVNAQRICNYFTDGTSGPLVEGERIVWRWSQWGDFPVLVRQLVANQLIHLEFDSTQWQKTTENGYNVAVFLEFEPLDEGSTMLRISEQGWPLDQPGLKGSHDNCSGWTHMAVCLKGYLEHGLDLRK